MIIANFIFDQKGKERFVVAREADGQAVLEHRWGPKGAKVIERGPECEVLLVFSDLIQEQVFATMPCPGCEACEDMLLGVVAEGTELELAENLIDPATLGDPAEAVVTKIEASAVADEVAATKVAKAKK